MSELPLDKGLYFLLNVAQQGLRQRVGQVCIEQTGLTAAQCGVLFYVSKHDGCLLKDLAEGLGLKSAAITGLVARTEKTGCIWRGASAADARATQLHLTPKGQRKLREIKRLNQVLQRRLTEGFGATEVDVVLRFLQHLTALASDPLELG